MGYFSSRWWRWVSGRSHPRAVKEGPFHVRRQVPEVKTKPNRRGNKTAVQQIELSAMLGEPEHLL
jgi:hypothetical protein